MSRRGIVLALAAALAAGGVAAWWLARAPSVVEEAREVERAWFALRDATLQDDDEAFFEMHGRNARKTALDQLPEIRAWYKASTPEQRREFQELYRISEEEFLAAEPRALVVRMLPWRSGWRERKEMFRVSRVKDVRFEPWTRPDGTPDRQAVVILDIGAALAPGEAERLPPKFLPQVVFIKEPEGWRRRAFFSD